MNPGRDRLLRLQAETEAAGSGALALDGEAACARTIFDADREEIEP